MKIIKTLLPGQNGTGKESRKYGDTFVCVRYRLDKKKREKLKTAEIIIERTPWQPDKTKIPANKLMPVKIAYGEADLAYRVKSRGGRWDRTEKVWLLPWKYVKILNIENRVVNMGGKHTNTCYGYI